MLPMRRVLQVAAPATLLGIFGVWFAVTPPSGRSNGTVRSGVESSLLNERRGVAPTMNPATRRALETAVNRQLDALGKGDYQAALRYAAVSFRERFTPRRFGELIREQFPAMLAVKKATFGPARHTSEMAEMTVILEGTDGGGSDSSSSGTRTQYIYIFSREGREWRITAVVPQFPVKPSPSAGARVAAGQERQEVPRRK